MHGAAWLAGLVCVLVVLVPTSLLVGAQEPEEPDAPSPSATDAARLQAWTGKSAVHLKGACIDERATCLGERTREDGSFFLPSMAQGGSIVVSWSPVNDSLRVLRVRAAGVELTGESPLRIDFIGLNAGAHSIELEPARRVLGAYDQSADWVATFAVTPPPETLETRGASSYSTAAGCVLGTCDPITQIRSDALVVPWNARGSLVADWDPLDGPMRVTVPGTGFAAQGEPPLTLPLDGLTAGQWSVEARPAALELPLADVSVGWVVALTPAP